MGREVLGEDNEFRESAANLDRVSLTVFRITLTGTVEDVTLFQGALAGTEFTIPNQGRTGLMGPDLDVFCSLQGSIRKRWIAFRERVRGNRHQANRPLMAGQFVFTRGPAATGPTSRNRTERFFTYNGRLNLTLNPTRAYVHQMPPTRTTRLPRRIDLNINSPIRLRTRELPIHSDEWPINPSDDNVILGNTSVATSVPQSFTRRYIEDAITQCAGWLNQARDNARASGASTFEIRIDPYVNLKCVETYWETLDADPIGTTHRLAPHFLALGSHRRNRVYENVVADRDTVNNAPSLQTRMREGLTAKLYPKTNRRLRLELTHDLRHSNDFDGGHTFEGVDAFDNAVALIERCKAEAANQVMTLRTGLAIQEPTDQTEVRTTLDLIRVFLNSPGTTDERTHFMSMLAFDGCIDVLPNDRIRPISRYFIARGVLIRPRPHARTLVVRAEFQAACADLRSVLNGGRAAD